MGLFEGRQIQKEILQELKQLNFQMEDRNILAQLEDISNLLMQINNKLDKLERR